MPHDRGRSQDHRKDDPKGGPPPGNGHPKEDAPMTQQEYKVSDALWLEESTALAKAILTSPHHIGLTWTVEGFNAELDRIGIKFTGAELGQIAAKLIADGDLVAV